MRLRNRSIRNRSIISGIAFAVLALGLSGCTSDTSKRDANGLASHLTVDLKVTAPEKAQAEIPLTVEVSKDGEPLAQADKAEFVIWPESDPGRAVTVPAKAQQPGVYTADYVFGAEGLYIVQSRIAAANLEAIPAKRVAIGQAAVEKLSQMEHAGEEAPAESGGGHQHSH
ncbi:FixH family protein [Cohnella rhizosphaerae]|uniref:FixH family protein n=1 Tax=Cohnella rhizosphaerae TaxID=1457232 RepID=A0A9X4KZ92_9BACL|nr:FixH family protein [Cohnella rhizosphaerae]MDG0813590.1 FixH family protein [Cohnella rhizosphaerae]